MKAGTAEFILALASATVKLRDACDADEEVTFTVIEAKAIKQALQLLSSESS